MAYAAKIGPGDIVERVSRFPDIPDGYEGTEEQFLQDFIANTMRLDGEWIQTSFNGNIRRRFAGVGMRYDRALDMFIAASPFPSWVLDASGDWQAPVGIPTDGNQYAWNEDTLSWVLIPPEETPVSD